MDFHLIMIVIIIFSQLHMNFGSMATPKNSLGYVFGDSWTRHTPRPSHWRSARVRFFQ